MANLRPDEVVASANLTTYLDLVQEATDYAGASVEGFNVRHARRAVLRAYQHLAAERRWVYYRQFGTVVTVASYSTGTVVYDHTGGASERMVTLTTGTWPTWAAQGSILISDVAYKVATRVSDSVITLAVDSNPGADVASTTYTIYQDSYTLPPDLISIETMINQTSKCVMRYIDPPQWLSYRRATKAPANPWRFTVTASPNYHGLLAVVFDPPPNEVIRFDHYYHRRPRVLRISEYTTGTAACTSSSTTVTGTGTAWTSKMIGSVIRLSDFTEAVTSESGGNPAAIERIITAVASATQLTIDSAADDTLSGVAYVISDPVDVHPGEMKNYLLAEVERQIRIAARMEANPEDINAYQTAMESAKAADHVSIAPRWHGAGGGSHADIRDFAPAPELPSNAAP